MRAIWYRPALANRCFAAYSRRVPRPVIPSPLLALLALVAGGISALGFAPYGVWVATLLGIALLAGLVGVAPTRARAFLHGWLFGTGHFCASLTWIATAFTYQDKMPPMLGWATVLLLSMFLALYIGLAASITRAITREAIGRAFVLAACWMLAEWLRGWLLSGFAWNPLGAAALPMAGLAQFAAFIGALGVSGLIVLAGASIWASLEPGARLAQRAAGLGIAGTVGALAFAGQGLNTDTLMLDNPVIVIVQPNIGQDVKYAAGAEAAHLQRYIDMTRNALGTNALLAGDGTAAVAPGASTNSITDETPSATQTDSAGVANVAGVQRAEGQAALVIWSESSVFGLVEEDPALRARLAAILGPRDLLLFGGVAAIRDSKGVLIALTNSLFVIDAGGRILGRYDKSHLVPLGEYVPARGIMEAIGLARLAPGDIDFMAGAGPRTLKLPGLPAVGGQICYEIIFAGAVIDAANRPQWVANVSNDAWFGPSGPPQHLDQARLRAIEEGLPISRATPTGISAIIDARGNVIASSRLGEAAIVTATLPPPLPPTAFASLGHWTSGFLGVVLLVVGVVVGRTGRKV